jgi:hypothetical protein
MKAKLVTLGFTAIVILALVLQASSQAIAQGNANKPAATKKAPPKPPQAKPAPPAAAGDTAATAAKPKPKPKPTPKAANAMVGVPKGVPACINHLTQMAAKDPLIEYDGHPSDIVNGGLLWNDAKSHCYVADESTRKKVVELAGAWRSKDAAKVRSLLQELGGMAGK